MQQQSPQTMNTAVPSTPLHLVTTEQIQNYLEENKNLIVAIMECQNTGKLAECAQYQNVLQKNLMYLAAIADAQPPSSSSSSSQVPPTQGISPMMPQTQSPMTQQQTGAPSVAAPKLPFQLGNNNNNNNSNALFRPQDQYQLLQLQQHQQLQAQFGLGGNVNNAMNHMLMQPGLGGSGGRGKDSSRNPSSAGNSNAEGRE